MTSHCVPERVITESVDETVVRGSDDWVMLSEVDATVTWTANRYRAVLSPDEKISVSLEVVRRALEAD